MSQADVLTLKVNALNARNELANAMKQLNSVRFSFFSYLRVPEDPDIVLAVPDNMPLFWVDFDKALAEVQANGG